MKMYTGSYYVTITWKMCGHHVTAAWKMCSYHVTHVWVEGACVVIATTIRHFHEETVLPEPSCFIYWQRSPDTVKIP